MLRRRSTLAEEVFLPPGPATALDENSGDFSAIARARIQREVFIKELDLLRARLDIVQARVGTVARSSVEWANRSAEAQLGTHPWWKFAAIAMGPALVGRLLRNIPVAWLAMTIIPVAMIVVEKRRERDD